MPQPMRPSPGQIAYNAYCESYAYHHGVDDFAPNWEYLEPHVQAVWLQVADAVGRFIFTPVMIHPAPITPYPEV